MAGVAARRGRWVAEVGGPALGLGGLLEAVGGGDVPRRRFRPAVDALDIGPTRLHDLRHTFASLCASRGVPSQQVADWMGHANDVITRQIYTHLFDADSAAHADRLAEGGRPTASQSAGAAVTALGGRG